MNIATEPTRYQAYTADTADGRTVPIGPRLKNPNAVVNAAIAHELNAVVKAMDTGAVVATITRTPVGVSVKWS